MIHDRPGSGDDDAEAAEAPEAPEAPEAAEAAEAGRAPTPRDAALDRVHILVRGVVQGVGFRWFVQRTARELGLSGWVRNRSDGSVELIASGPADAVASMVAAVRTGPDGAMVTGTVIRHEPPVPMPPGFELRSGSHPGD